MTSFSIELTPMQEAQLIAAASEQGVAPETLVRQFVIERLPVYTHDGSNAQRTKIPADAPEEESISTNDSFDLIDEGGILVLAHIGVEIDDWDSLVDREREARFDALRSTKSR
jgi:predicted metal-dependent phosphoesterase TrpH